jgi:hypothetical protein
MKVKFIESVDFEKALFEAGKSYEKGSFKPDPEELKMGIEVEKEHSNDMKIRTKIAKDHLAEFDKYYSWLKFMEDLMKKYKTPEDYKGK